MLDKKGQVLYVGKAKNLPNRLKSYAADKNQTIRTERMLALKVPAPYLTLWIGFII